MTQKDGQFVPLETAKEQVEKACRRIAMLHIAFARTLVNEFGEVEGRRIAMKAIKAYGKQIGESALKKTREKGLANTPENYAEDLPSFGLYEELERLETGHGSTIRLKGCVMGNTWKEIGEADLGRIYCYVDPAKSMAFNPDLALVHASCIPDGDPFCDLVYRETTGLEKEQFLEDDTDLGKVDHP